MNRRIAALALVFWFPASPAIARHFESRLTLKVFLRESGDIPDRVIGFTPVRKGRIIRIPEGKIWYVRPIGTLSGLRLDELARLSQSQRIPGLDLSDHWELSDASLRHLRGVAHLQMLDISRTRITDKGVASLGAFHELAILALPEAVSDRGLSDVGTLTALRELSLDQTHAGDEGLQAITPLVHLERLDLSGTQVTDAGAAFLGKFPHLRRLILGGGMTDVSAPQLKTLKALEEIDITQTQIGEEGLKALAALPNLKTIYVGRQAATEGGLGRLSKSHSLRALDLSRTNVTSAGVRNLTRLKSLEELALNQTAVGDECVPSLAKLPELRMLDLSETHVTIAGVEALARAKKLEVLSLSWSRLTREDLQRMSQLRQLKTIILNGVPLPDSTMAQLKRLRPWDSVVGLERARMHEGPSDETLALGEPVRASAPNLHAPGLSVVRTASLPRSRLPETPFEQAAPEGGLNQARLPASQKAEIAALKKPARTLGTKSPDIAPPTARPERIAPSGAAKSEGLALTVGPSLKDAGYKQDQRPQALASFSGERSGESVPGPAPTEIASKEEEDTLLNVIALQSNPAKAGAFSGLSGLRQIRQTETLASLNRISEVKTQATVPEEDEDPSRSVGEISVGVIGRRRH